VVLQQDQEVPQILVKWMNLPTCHLGRHGGFQDELSKH
jgi:hypothetical protein